MQAQRTLVSLLLLLATATVAVAKTPTHRITIQGADLPALIEITEPDVVRNFQVWAGAGTSTADRHGFIVDWHGGAMTTPPKTLPRYQVSFYAKHQPTRPIYVVFYAFDPDSKKGFVYLPGKTEKWYRLNTSAVWRGVEGKWFTAWQTWDDVAGPLITRVRAPQ
jgi:hypothetical protein